MLSLDVPQEALSLIEEDDEQLRHLQLEDVSLGVLASGKELVIFKSVGRELENYSCALLCQFISFLDRSCAE